MGKFLPKSLISGALFAIAAVVTYMIGAVIWTDGGVWEGGAVMIGSGILALMLGGGIVRAFMNWRRR
ncbi:MAG: hypothetical protein HY873_03050 [Chloroflexi bacterium]|nr:hypothetical protein [Chloroflexota bacterium]